MIWVALTPWLAKRSALKALPYLTEERVDELRKRRDDAALMEARREHEEKLKEFDGRERMMKEQVEAEASESSNAVRTV